MATKKKGAYVVLRDCGVGVAGDTVDLDDETAAELIRDGMITQAEE